MKSEYVPPAFKKNAFNCPACHVFAKQKWFFMAGASQENGYGQQFHDERFLVSSCESCSSPTIWLGEKIIFPIHSIAESPNPDLPEEIERDFEEARQIAALSPRGAAALLRLAIQKLCAHLGESGRNVNADIKGLVDAGLPSRVQQALDSVRVIGNNAVHPGEMDLRDDMVTVNKLFKLVNFIATKMITEPKEIDDIYNGLPTSSLNGIKKRDGAS